ncbi:hypothetical protein QF035_004064 [Streptomyces umbrinus]|uniref:Uncharacterized protein n=1 Tax=Streptomyces umbrinus TaxID=67370 RepID=A0ABU0ST40_9ACTN|nr:hypothetical protein [Streptomyces umbrinus]MDQ1026482.1 hypothetical protein [Streptomyces umbrinus]
MSRPPENENGVSGANAANNAAGAPAAHGAQREGDEPVVPPIVYHPQVEETPAYDEYADPATAHGWQNAYDETRELPPVAAGAEDRRRVGGGRRSRRKPGALPSRRVAVAAGAVGAVSLAAVMAGFSFGPSDGGARGNEDRTSPTAGDPASPTDAKSSGGASAARSSDGGEPFRTGDPSSSASPAPTGDETEKPAAKSPTTPLASSTPTAITSPRGPGNSDGKPGRGQGGTKGPK